MRIATAGMHDHALHGKEKNPPPGGLNVSLEQMALLQRTRSWTLQLVCLCSSSTCMPCILCVHAPAEPLNCDNINKQLCLYKIKHTSVATGGVNKCERTYTLPRMCIIDALLCMCHISWARIPRSVHMCLACHRLRW